MPGVVWQRQGSSAVRRSRRLHALGFSQDELDGFW